MDINESKFEEKKFKARRLIDEISVSTDIANSIIDALVKSYELEISEIRDGCGPIRVIIKIYEVLKR